MERKLDRLPHFDERSLAYPIRALIEQTKPRSYTWACGLNLDQGREGACVGFGWSHERIAKPTVDLSVTEEDAGRLYLRAKELDQWPGEDYDGSSVLGGAKASKERGWLHEYRWAFTLTDALLAISYHGPVVIGVNWYEGMMHPDDKGIIHASGDIAGGHCTLIRGINVKTRMVLIHNSWGSGWAGTDKGPGTTYLSWDDLDRLIGEEGDCCIPVRR